MCLPFSTTQLWHILPQRASRASNTNLQVPINGGQLAKLQQSKEKRKIPSSSRLNSVLAMPLQLDGHAVGFVNLRTGDAIEQLTQDFDLSLFPDLRSETAVSIALFAIAEQVSCGPRKNIAVYNCEKETCSSCSSLSGARAIFAPPLSFPFSPYPSSNPIPHSMVHAHWSFCLIFLRLSRRGSTAC